MTQNAYYHQSRHRNWKRTWGAAPQVGADSNGALWAQEDGVTLRQIVRISGGGEQVRVRFTNEYGVVRLGVGAASIGIAALGGGIQKGSLRELTFDGKTSASIPGGAPLLSDAVTLSLEALTEVVVSVYLPRGTECETSHNIPTSLGWVISGNAVDAGVLPIEATPLPRVSLLSALEILVAEPGVGIVMLGDSITDGAGSTPGAHRSWPELLADRLLQAPTTNAYVSNQGISGNRLLHPGYGEAALARFDRDVLSTPGLDVVVLFQGINDIGFQYGVNALDEPEGTFMNVTRGVVDGPDDIIAAYEQLIRRTRSHNAKIFGATLTPFRGAEFFSREGELVRQQINSWIRTSNAFDAVLDFEAAWIDPDAGSIKDGYHWGDFLHGSDTGYQALADSVDLSLFSHEV